MSHTNQPVRPKTVQPRHLGFKKKGNCTVREMKIKALPTHPIRAFVLASEKVSFLITRFLRNALRLAIF